MGPATAPATTAERLLPTAAEARPGKCRGRSALAGDELTERRDVVLRSEDERRALVELLRQDVEDAILAVDRRATRLLEEERHRVRFVEETELAVRALRVGRIGEDAALDE